MISKNTQKVHNCAAARRCCGLTCWVSQARPCRAAFACDGSKHRQTGYRCVTVPALPPRPINKLKWDQLYEQMFADAARLPPVPSVQALTGTATPMHFQQPRTIVHNTPMHAALLGRISVSTSVQAQAHSTHSQTVPANRTTPKRPSADVQECTSAMVSMRNGSTARIQKWHSSIPSGN